MQWVIKFLKRRLSQEQDIAAFHGSMASVRQYAESARMARQRIPQLQDAIHILESHAGPIARPERIPARQAQPADRQLTLF